MPLHELSENHRVVQLSISSLLRRYRSDLQVSFMLLHNTGAKGVEGITLVIPDTELGPDGALHYSQRYEDYYGEAVRQIETLNPL